MTAEMPNSGRRPLPQGRLQCCTSSLWILHTLSEEKHIGQLRSVSVGFGRFWTVSDDFGRFQRSLERLAALRAAC